MEKPTIVIEQSKNKLLLLGFVATLFVCMGVFILFHSPNQNQVGLVWLFQLLTFLGVFFFGAIGFFFIKKYRENKPGFVIQPDGIEDYSGVVSAGFIPWEAIGGFETVELRKRFYILIHLKNPQSYIEKERNSLKKKVLEANLKYFQTPFAVDVSTLNTTVEYLETTLESYWENGQ